MKLVIRYCLPWGNIASLPLELDTSADVDNLFDMIAEKLNIPKSKQLLKHKTGGKIVKKILLTMVENNLLDTIITRIST